MKRKHAAREIAQSPIDRNALTMRERIGSLRDCIDNLRQQAEAVTQDLDVVSLFSAQDLAFETNMIDFYEEVRRFEIFLIKNALRRTSGSQKKAARLLQLNETTLNSKLKNLKINHREYSVRIEEPGN